jgi:2,3-dihydroxybenzoate decarboxylase
MFSADYPFEDLLKTARWFDSATIAEADRIKIGQTNARRLFKL